MRQSVSNSTGSISLWKWLTYPILIFLILIFLLPLLLHLGPIQHFALNKIGTSISKKTNTKTTAESINFSIFKGLVLNDIIILSNNTQDTLLEIGSLNTSLYRNLTSLYNKELDIESIELYHLKGNIDITQGAVPDELLDLFSKKDGEKTSKNSQKKEKLKLDIRNISLREVDIYLKTDALLLDVKLEKADAKIKEIIGLVDELILESIKLKSPKVKLVRYDTKNMNSGDLAVTIHDSFDIRVLDVNIEDGEFYLNKWGGQVSQYGQFNSEDIAINDLNLQTKNLNYSSTRGVETEDLTLSCEEHNGFKLEELSANNIQILNTVVSLDEFVLRTPNSSLGDSLRFSFTSFSMFKDFIKDVSVDAHLDASQISIKDLKYFIRDIDKIPFFKANKERQINISGDFKGLVDNLRARNLNLQLGNLVELQGSLSVRGLSRAPDSGIDFGVERLRSSVENLRQLIPQLKLPDQFNKLGQIDFTGNIEGLMSDFVLHGQLNSAIGTAELDTRIDINDAENVNYSGFLGLSDFNLESWTDNSDFGMLSAQLNIRNGKGLKFSDFETDISGSVSRFEYNNYIYKDLELSGFASKNQFDGELTSRDPNLDFVFIGLLNFEEEKLSSGQFESKVNNIDLSKLKLSKDTIRIVGDINMSFKNQGGLYDGSLAIDKGQFIMNGIDIPLDSVRATSHRYGADRSRIELHSDIISLDLDGKYKLDQVPVIVVNDLVENHPGWAERFGIQKRNVYNPADQSFKLNFSVPNSHDYLTLLGVYDLWFQNLNFFAEYENASEFLDSKIDVDTLSYKTYQLSNLGIDLSQHNASIKNTIVVGSLLAGGQYLDDVNIYLDLEADSAALRVKSINSIAVSEAIDLEWHALPTDDRFEIRMKTNRFNFLGGNWSINPENKLIIGDQYLDLNSFELTDGSRTLYASTDNHKNLNLNIVKFDFDIINTVIAYEKIDFAGIGNMDLAIDNIFVQEGFRADIHFPELRLNGEDYGNLAVSVRENKHKAFRADLTIYKDDGHFVGLEGFYYPNTNTIDAKLNAKGFPMKFFEYIIPEGISRTSGTTDLEVRLLGTDDDLYFNGIANLKECYTRIDYLGNYVKMGDEPIYLTDTLIDFSQATLQDRLGNTARLSGGLKHVFFRDFTTVLNISSDKFLALDTDKEDNEDFYGTVIGDFDINFSGPFDVLDIDVSGSAEDGTVFNIPTDNSDNDYGENFIAFIDKEEYFSENDSLQTSVNIEGLNMAMNLTVSPEAEFNLIFNERLNDIIHGRGAGDLRLVFDRDGDLNIFGQYEISEGEYLFTALGFIAKPFEVTKGGLITWSGDPYNASLNLTAEYKGLRAPLDVFLAEYLPDESDIKREARKKTNVDLQMYITGLLSSPEINFDLAFPDLQGELRSFADSKIRTLHENEAALNNQVASLIVFRTFIPSSNSEGNLVTSNNWVATSFNTLSEFFTSQLSQVVSGFLQDALVENGLVSGIDFELGLTQNTSLLTQNNNNEFIQMK